MTVSRSSVGKSEPDNDTGGALPKFIGGVVKSEYFSVILESDKKDCSIANPEKETKQTEIVITTYFRLLKEENSIYTYKLFVNLKVVQWIAIDLFLPEKVLKRSGGI